MPARANFATFLAPFVLVATLIAVFSISDPMSGHAQQLGGGALNQLQQALGANGSGASSLGGLGAGVNQQQDLQNTTQRPALPLPNIALVPSRLEQIMSQRAGTRLAQFGYDQFGIGRAVSIPQVGAIQDSYILGTGDELIVGLRGQENGELRVTVDRNGQVIIPRLSPIPAAGRNFGDFNRDLQAAVRRSYISTTAFASIAKVRQIGVVVSGEVNAPGQRLISGLGSVTDVLLLSGGIKKTGSLRNIRVLRGDTSFTLDLYSLLTSGGDARRVNLADGDRIVVLPLGKTVAVSGLVRQPGIYELAPGASGISVRSLIAQAGGQEVKGSYRLSALRVVADGNTRMEQLSGDTGVMGDSEILFVQLRANQTMSQATLSGGTGLAGQYPISTGTRLSDVLRAPGALGPAPYTLFGVIARKDPRTLLRHLTAFTPIAIMAGGEDIPLQSEDVIRVFSVDEIRLLSNTVRLYAQRQVAEQEAIRNPLSASDNNPASPVALPSAAGGASAAAAAAAMQQAAASRGTPGATSTVADLQRSDIADLATQIDPVSQQALDAHAMARQQEQAARQGDLIQQQNAAIVANPVYAGEGNQTGIIGLSGLSGVPGAFPASSQNFAAPQIAAAPPPPPPALNFEAPDVAGGQIASNREITNFGDLARQLGIDQLVLVNFLMDHQVVLNGAVSGPGSYFVGPNVALQDLVQAAGGTTNWADASGVELISTAVDSQAGRSATRRTMLPLRQGMLTNYVVHPRDQFRFNQVFTDSGLGSATVQGEVRFTGTYQITRGEHLSDLLSRAGGLTSTAYPYGTVFLRKSAAATERDGYIRAAAEIENQLVVAMTHIGNDKIDPGSFASLQVFVNELRNQKAFGRIAIAADPAVLAANPALDPLLEAGDVLYIPQRPTTIAVLGQVMQPGSFPYRAGLTLADYVEQAGGYSASSDSSLTFIVLPDGSARRVRKSWLSFDAETLPPGSTIVVPRDVTPLNTRQLILDVTSIFSQLAVSLASLAVIAKN